MQQLHRNPSGQWGCLADGCPKDAVLGWTRLAPGGDVPVYGCEEHTLSLAQAAQIHDAECLAPPTCTCSVAEGGTG